MARAIVQRVFPGELLADETYELIVKGQRKGAVKPGHVLVKVTMRPVHPIDLHIVRTGELVIYKEQGVTLGSEGVGFVAEIGEGVKGFTVGQRVVPILFWKYFRSGAGGIGSWQDYVEVAEEDVVLVPNSVSDEAACQYVINPWTAHGLMVDIAIPKREYLLLSAANSIIGRQLIQIASHWGIRVIAIVRRDGLEEELKGVGACHVINSSTDDIVGIVKEITHGKGAYAALDGVCGAMTKSIGASVRDGGKLFVFGTLGGTEFSFSVKDLIRHVQLSWWMLTPYLENPGNYERTKREVMQMLESHVLQPLAGKKFHLKDFKEAIEESQMDSRGGKVLLID
ncbi:unnamed protein product [Calypogeia fissa]